MTGALLSEVWPDMVQKCKKTKKLKKKKSDDPLFDAPLTPDEMETELLDDRENPELDPTRRLRGMRVSPYTDDENQYQDTKKTVDLDFNNNIVRPDNTRNIVRESLEDDPDYQEFLEFKRMKAQKRKQPQQPKPQVSKVTHVESREPSHVPSETSYEDQWKKINVINTSIKLNINVSVNSKDYNTINALEESLKKIDLVSKFKIDQFSNKKIIYKITYNGTPDKFLSDFIKHGLKVNQSKEIWEVFYN